MTIIESTLNDWSKKEISWLVFCLIFTTIAGIVIHSSSLILTFSLLNIISLILAAKGKVLTYLFGFISAIMYAVISYQNDVYGQLLLAVLFLLPIQFYGWYNWTRPKNTDSKSQIKVNKLSLGQFTTLIATILLISFIYGYFILHLYFKQDIGIVADSLVGVISVVAFILTVLLYRELWFLWLAVDVFTIVIWMDGVFDQAITIAILPVIITKLVALLNAIYGYMSWRKFYK